MIESIIRRDGVWNLSHAFRWFPEHMPNKQLHWSTLPLKFSPGQTPFEYELLKNLRHNFMVEKFKHFGQVRKTPGAWALENDRNDEDLGDKQLIYFGSLSFSTLVIYIIRILPLTASEFSEFLSQRLSSWSFFSSWLLWAGLMPNLIADQQIGDKVWEAMKISCGWLSTTIPIILKI